MSDRCVYFLPFDRKTILNLEISPTTEGGPIHVNISFSPFNRIKCHYHKIGGFIGKVFYKP